MGEERRFQRNETRPETKEWWLGVEKKPLHRVKRKHPNQSTTEEETVYTTRNAARCMYKYRHVYIYTL